VNRDRHRYWSAYIADVQGRMLLADWRITLSRKPTDHPHVGASVDCVPGQHVADVWLNKDFDHYLRATQRHIVVHELVHLHLSKLEFHLFTQTRDLGEHEKASIEQGHKSHEEYAVDDLARIIAPHMPLPPKVAKP
jgi:hypothetical protein